MSGAEHWTLSSTGGAARDSANASAGRGVEYILRLGRFAQERDRLLHAEEGNLPLWAENGRDYFRAADDFLLRRNGRLAQNLTFALPVELNHDEHVELIRAYVNELLGTEALPYTWAYHEGYGHNPHVHLLISESANDGIERSRELWFRRANSKEPARGGAPKSQRFYARSVPEELRTMWQRHANHALEQAGLDVRVDMRSYKRRGLELRPQVKQGRDLESVLDEADGRTSVVASAAAQNLTRTLQNAERIERKPELLLDLCRHQRSITRDQLERELASRCTQDEDQPERIRAALDARLTRVGSDRRGHERLATREQLIAEPSLAIEALTLNRSTFTERDLADLFGSDEAGEAALARALGSSELVYAGVAPVRGAKARDEHETGKKAEAYQERFTSRSLLAAEQRLARNADELHRANGPRLDPQSVRRAVQNKTLDRLGGDEQQRMLHALAGTDGTNSALVLVQGRPGTGKSYVVGALREAAEGSGVRIIGTAIAGKAASALGRDAGIESFTVAKLVSELQRGKLDLKGAVLVVDEAGMADTRSLDQLLSVARAAGVGRIALVGDTHQLTPVGAGTPFEQLQRSYGAIALENNQRQEVEWQKEASRLMASGRREDLEAGVNAYLSRGLVHEHEYSADAHAAIVNAWTEHRKRAPNETRLVIAFRRDAVATLNTQMREALRAEGLLGEDRIVIDSEGVEHRFAAGDQLVFKRPDSSLQTKNGTLAKVIAVRDGVLHLRVEDGRTLTLNAAEYAPKLEHGFATTIHRAQGATAHQVFVYASSNFTAETTFVALTRHKLGLELHYDRAEFTPEARFVQNLVDVDTTPEQRMVRALSRSDREPNATEAVAQGLQGRVTDPTAHVARYKTARSQAAREAYKRQLEALARTSLNPTDALTHHPAVELARKEFLQAQENLARVKQRAAINAERNVARLAKAPPRSMRFGAQLRFASRYADVLGESSAIVAQAEAAAAQSEAVLKHVLAHPDVQAAAQRAMALQSGRATSAQQALEQIRAVDLEFKPLDAVHAYGLSENARLGYPLYRAGTTDDRSPQTHHRLVEVLRVEEHTLAILETDNGQRLVYPVSEKSAQWLKPGDRVGFAEGGPWLEKRNQAWADEQVRRDLTRRGVPHPVPRLGPDELLTLELSDVAELPGGIRYALARTTDGQERVLDLTHLHDGALFRAGDRVQQRQVAAPSDEAGGQGRSYVRLERVDASLTGEDTHELLASLRDELRTLQPIANKPAPSRSSLLSRHPEGRPIALALAQARREEASARAALEKLEPGAPPEARALLQERLDAAQEKARAARGPALALHRREDIQMDLTRLEAEARREHEAASRRVEQLERDLPMIERDSAARAVARDLAADRPTRVVSPTDKSASFILEKEVTREGQRLAVLLAEDGHTVVMPVTGHDKAMAELTPGQLVRLDREGRQLYPVAPREAASLREEAERLRLIVEQPRPQLEDLLRQVPEARELAERVIETRDTLRAARDNGAPAKTEAIAAARAKAALERALDSNPELRARGAHMVAEQQQEWRAARSALGKLEARLSQPERAALHAEARHQLNRGRDVGAPMAREMAEGDSGYVWERLESRGSSHVAVLRNGEGARVTRDVSFDHALRERASAGMPVVLRAGERGTRLELDSSTEERALTKALEQVRQERGRARAWQPDDVGQRFVYVGERHQDALEIALLGAEDGYTVLRALAPADARAAEGQIVAQRAGSASLDIHARAYREKLDARIDALEEQVRRPAFKLEDGFAEIAETREQALAFLKADARVRTLRDRVVDEPGLESDLQSALARQAEARQALHQASTANPTAYERAEQLRRERGKQWHQAKLELTRLEQQRDLTVRDAAQRLLNHDTNRTAQDGQPPVRSARAEDKSLVLEAFVERGPHTFAIGRSGQGERVSADVTDSRELREQVRPGMTMHIERNGAQLSLRSAREQDRALEPALTPHLPRPFAPTRGGR